MTTYFDVNFEPSGWVEVVWFEVTCDGRNHFRFVSDESKGIHYWLQDSLPPFPDALRVRGFWTRIIQESG